MNNTNDEQNNKDIDLETVDDVSFEEVDSDGDSISNPLDLIKKLKEKIKTLEKEKAEYLLGWQKDKADFINLRKKDEEVKKGVIDVVKQNFIIELLPVLDSFEIALKNKEAWEKVDQNWRVGVEYIINQLKTILESNGLQRIYPLGEKFDPNRDDAIENIDTDDKNKDNIVLEVVSTGYKIGDNIIRPAKVKVGVFNS
jgi:molecular chaperone GrpE